MTTYEYDQINNLLDDEFYKVKIVCGFKDSETKCLTISPIELQKIKEIFKDKLLICPKCKSNKLCDNKGSTNLKPIQGINFICQDCLYEW